MSQKYLLPCPACGDTIPVEIAQAGASVACACGALVDVPGLRQLKQLPPAETDTEASVPTASGWGLRQGLMLAGLLLILLGVIPAIYWTVNFPEPPPKDVSGRIDRDNEHIDKMSPLAAWILWKAISEQGLQLEQTPGDVAFEKNARNLRIKIVAAGALAVVGLTMVFAGLAVGAPRQRAA